MITPDRTCCKDVTADSMFNGSVICKQYKNGYRYSVDAILLAQFHKPTKGETILDLGSGCGIISLILMYRWGNMISELCALEYQPQLCELINENFRINNYRDTCRCINGDVKEIRNLVEAESFSFVTCNPPFFNPDRGRLSIGKEARIARHEIAANLNDFILAAARSVKNSGTVIFIYPADKFTHLLETLAKYRLEVKTIQFVYSYPNMPKNARLVLVRCVKNGKKGVTVAPPFYIYTTKNGNYSEEMQSLYLA